ncbi:MAG: isoprenylcysteine carboxylmethyltransferase family protein [Bacteroidota bacterium]
MKGPSLFAHLRDILLLPVMVTIVVPYLIFNSSQHSIPGSLLIQLVWTGDRTRWNHLVILHDHIVWQIWQRHTCSVASNAKLVIIGPYRYVRNPMISGVFFILIGESLVLHSTSILEWAGLFFLINTTYFILSEEPSLEDRFGEDYRQYKKHVGRWIPRLRAYSL